jgi:transcriptional regulator with XRE-family HTH domain
MSENLSQFLKRIMKQKGLTLRDVEQKCGKRITNSYISRLINGKVNNLTVETIGAVAQGFDVDPYDVFSAAYGEPPRDAAVDPLVLVDMLQKLATNPNLIKAVREWMKLSAKERAAVMRAIRNINELKSAKKSQDKK